MGRPQLDHLNRSHLLRVLFVSLCLRELAHRLGEQSLDQFEGVVLWLLERISVISPIENHIAGALVPQLQVIVLLGFVHVFGLAFVRAP